MKDSIRHGFLLASTVLALTLCGCGPTDKEKQAVSQLTSDMYSTCVGRFLIQLPRGMTNASINSNVTLFYGLDTDFKTVDISVESRNATTKQLRDDTERKAADIARDNNWQTNESMLLEHRNIDDHTVYLRYWDGMEGAIAQKREIHMLAGKTILLIQANSYDGLRDKNENGTQVDKRLFKLASQIHAYEDPEKAGPGFCLGDTVIDGDNDEEQAQIAFLMPNHPDLQISIYSKGLTSDSEEKSLLDRSAGFLSRPDVHVLRKGIATLGGMQAQEVLTSGKDAEHGKKKLLMFTIHSQRPDPALVRPQMSVSLDAGGQLTEGPREGEYVDASLTDAEAVALWDTIVKSIRLRPGAAHGKS